MHLIRLNDVSQSTGLRRSTIYIFSKAVSLGGGRVAWVEQEIQD
ncbi:AlpA family phage regulatory protein [Herbaspirillum sp. RV1423]|nr:AlpA family phage regulatory protein [Herbaspirillum sp. RV1423]